MFLFGCTTMNQAIERKNYFPWENDTGYSQVVKSDKTLYISGITSEKETFVEQVDDIYTIIKKILADYDERKYCIHVTQFCYDGFCWLFFFRFCMLENSISLAVESFQINDAARCRPHLSRCLLCEFLIVVFSGDLWVEWYHEAVAGK